MADIKPKIPAGEEQRYSNTQARDASKYGGNRREIQPAGECWR